MSPEGRTYFARLSDLEYELEAGSPDVMGWEVADVSGERFGTVEDLLVDMNSGQILFGIIGYQADGEPASTLVPLPGANADTENKLLVLSLEQQYVREAPRFTDEVEDVQPYFEYWATRMEEWDAEDEEED